MKCLNSRFETEDDFSLRSPPTIETLGLQTKLYSKVESFHSFPRTIKSSIKVKSNNLLVSIIFKLLEKIGDFKSNTE